VNVADSKESVDGKVMGDGYMLILECPSVKCSSWFPESPCGCVGLAKHLAYLEIIFARVSQGEQAEGQIPAVMRRLHYHNGECKEETAKTIPYEAMEEYRKFLKRRRRKAQVDLLRRRVKLS
jgi:hypothetical protein